MKKASGQQTAALQMQLRRGCSSCWPTQKLAVAWQVLLAYLKRGQQQQQVRRQVIGRSLKLMEQQQQQQIGKVLLLVMLLV
jgi:hypothetical protein